MVEVETVTSGLQSAVKDLQREIRTLSTDLVELQKLAEEAVGRSHRNNIRFIGFGEGMEAPAADLFLETWLTTTVLKDNIPKFYSIEEAHMTPGRPPPPGAPARPIIASFINY